LARCTLDLEMGAWRILEECLAKMHSRSWDGSMEDTWRAFGKMHSRSWDVLTCNAMICFKM
jgi:hypothetical protein